MNLDEAQKATVSRWIAEGLKLSDIQKRLGSELGLNLTYMEVRFLVDDLKLTPKDAEPVAPSELTRAEPPPSAALKPGISAKPGAPSAPVPGPPGGGVTVAVDSIARPGTVVSGTVTFTDGNIAEWYLDQSGRLGLMPKQQGYRPSQQDVTAFQAELQTELAKLGF
jgi:hypothetical protein